MRSRRESSCAPIPAGRLPDGTACDHDGEFSTYCTRCWMNLYKARHPDRGQQGREPRSEEDVTEPPAVRGMWAEDATPAAGVTVYGAKAAAKIAEPGSAMRLISSGNAHGESAPNHPRSVELELTFCGSALEYFPIW